MWTEGVRLVPGGEVKGDPMSTAPTGRRAQNRRARHDQLMAAATEIIAESGVDGLTMQAVSERVDCAVGTIYTYFTSKSALVAEIQIAALATLTDSFERSREVWDVEIEAAGLDDGLASLVRIVAFGELFTAGPSLHPREFELLQLLISTERRSVDDADTAKVAGPSLELLFSLQRLVVAAIDSGTLSLRTMPDGGTDDALSRTIRWVGGLNGALLVSNATASPDWLSADLLDGRQLALRLAEDLLLGWGAPLLTLEAAHRFVAGLAERDLLLRPGRTERSVAAADGGT